MRANVSAGCRRLQKMNAPLTSGRHWMQEAGALICSCLFILGIAAAQAAQRPQKLRAGSGMRQDDIKFQHLTHKAVCSQDFLGQTPLFKGEWIPHKVSCTLIMSISMNLNLRAKILIMYRAGLGCSIAKSTYSHTLCMHIPVTSTLIWVKSPCCFKRVSAYQHKLLRAYLGGVQGDNDSRS